MSDNQTDEPQEPKKPVNVTGGKGVVIGDFNQVVQNFLADPRMRWYVLAVGVLVIVVGVSLYFSLSASNRRITASSLQTAIPPTPTSPPKFMSGNINIAVSAFGLEGATAPTDPLLGRKLAENLYKNLDAQVEQLRAGGALDLPEVWGPAQFEPVTGDTPESRATAAGEIARKYHIHILIYGIVETGGSSLRIAPEFTISERDFYDAREITGPYELGTPFSVQGEPFSAPFNVLLNRQMTPRVQTLTLLIEGLSYYVTRDFPRALEVLRQAADNPPERLPQAGREVIYLLAGNAAQQAGQYEQATQYYDRSLGEDNQYARAMIGKASVFYLQAIQPFAQSKQAADVDQALLAQSMELYRAALTAANQPPQADIAVKVHFGLGQDLYYRVLTGQETHFDAAIAEFEAVTGAYEAGDAAVKVRIRDMAGSAHGHLGLIYEQAGRKDLAIPEYEQAAALLRDSFDAERQQWYEQRAAKLKGG